MTTVTEEINMTTVREEIDSIKQHIATAYGAVKGRGGTLPEKTNCANLAEAINSISTGIDISDTTATAADVRVGKDFYAADGTKTQGTIADYDGQTDEVLEQRLTTLEAVLSKAQYGMSSVAVGDKIYLHGQKENFEVFDTTTNTLQTLNSKTLLWSYYGAMAAVDNKVYLFDAQGSNKIVVLDIITDTIQELSKTYNSYASGVAVGTKIYLFGGEASSTETNKICVFDTTNNNMTTLSSTLPASARRIGVVAVGTKIYLFGGDNSIGTYGTFLDTINVFDTDTNTLSTLDVTLPTPASAIGVSAIEKKIYLFGGMTTNSGKLSTINVFDTETNTISTLPITLSAATLGISASTIGNNIYLFGGQASNSLNSIQKFTVQSVTNISITDKNGITLKTQGKYCTEDVSVKPVLQTKTVTANGDISPDEGYCGLGKVTVNVPAMPTQEKTITITENGTQEVIPDSGNVLSKVTVTTNVSSGLAIKGLVEQYTIQAGETISAGNFVEWITSIGDGSAMFATAELIDASTVLLTTTTTLQILKISNNAISIGAQLTFTSVCACKFSSNKVVAITNGNTIRLYGVNNTTLEEVSNITSTNISSTGAIVCLDNNNLVTVFYKYENSRYYAKTVLININGSTITDYLLTDAYGSEYDIRPLRLLKLDDSHIFVAGNYGYYASMGGGPGFSPGPQYYSYFATYIIDTINKTSSKIAGGHSYSESYRDIESLRYSNNVVIGKNSSYIIKISISDTYSISVSTTAAITNMKGMISISNTKILTTVNNNICIYDVSNTTATLVSSKSFSDDSSAIGYSISYLNDSNYLLCFKIGTSYYFKTVTINNDEIEFPNSPYTKIARAASNNVPVGVAAQSGVGGDIINVYVPIQLWLSAPQILITDNTISWNAVENAVDYAVYDNNTLISTQTSTTYSLTNLSYGSHKIAVKALATTEYDISPQSNILDFIWNVYNVTTNLTNITANTSNPTTVSTVASSTLTFTANTGYNLPDNVTVTGATGVWDKDAGTLTLSNPTSDVTFTIVGVQAASGYKVTVDAGMFYNSGNLVRINGVEQELDGQRIYTFNNVNTFNIYSSTAMSNITSGTGSIPATYDWSSGWAWSTDIAITQDSSCNVSNDN